MIAAVEAGARRLCAEADQRRRRRRPGDARRGAQVQARRAGRHAAPQHAAPGRGARPHRSGKGKLGKVGLVEIYCYYHMRATAESAGHAAARDLDYEMWTGPAPMRPYNALVHPRSWRAFMEYGNGIVGDMCIHMLDMVRWMLDLGWPTRISSAGGILVEKESKANITDTQTATFDFGDLQVVWTHRIVRRRARSEVSLGGDVLRRQGHAQGQRDGLRLHARRRRTAADARGRDLRAGAVPGGSGPRRIWRSTSRRRCALT